jgi:methyltransferase (TIGR00027 family)
VRDVSVAPEDTAVRVALWRALHLTVDGPPPIFQDDLGMKLVDPPAGWTDRPDMNPQRTALFRASIVARARFVEDLVVEHASRGLAQYVILGAGLDTFAQRRRNIASTMTVFEVDRAEPQIWKRNRLIELGFGAPSWLRFVAVDFERDDLWQRLREGGFDPAQPAFISCVGVSMYLTRGAIAAMLGRIAELAPGSTLAMTFLLPIEYADEEERIGLEFAEKGARANGTPFLSYLTPEEILRMAADAGLAQAQYVPAGQLRQEYFERRTDGLRLGNAEAFLVAMT